MESELRTFVEVQMDNCDINQKIGFVDGARWLLEKTEQFISEAHKLNGYQDAEDLRNYLRHLCGKE